MKKLFELGTGKSKDKIKIKIMPNTNSEEQQLCQIVVWNNKILSNCNYEIWKILSNSNLD